MKAHIKVHAKLNLTLGISGVNGGYHTIESLVCSLDLTDQIVMSKRKDKLVTVEMHGMGSETLEFENNNAQKAATRYMEAFGCTGADIVVYKNIPLGAGLGGSSADAAGVLRGMTKLYGYGSEAQLKTLADGLGSDTGYMLSGGFAVISGRGETVTPVSSREHLHLLLLCPKSSVSTAECYREFDKSPTPFIGSAEAVKALERGDLEELGKRVSNGLFDPASKLNPDVKRAYDELKAFSPLGVGMTGSGSAAFALFENAHYVSWAKSRYRGKFDCIAVKTV